MVVRDSRKSTAATTSIRLRSVLCSAFTMVLKASTSFDTSENHGLSSSSIGSSDQIREISRQHCSYTFWLSFGAFDSSMYTVGRRSFGKCAVSLSVAHGHSLRSDLSRLPGFCVLEMSGFMYVKCLHVSALVRNSSISSTEYSLNSGAFVSFSASENFDRPDAGSAAALPAVCEGLGRGGGREGGESANLWCSRVGEVSKQVKRLQVDRAHDFLERKVCLWGVVLGLSVRKQKQCGLPPSSP